MILAEKIIRLRKQLGWSQEELADKMNVSRQSVSKWESTNSIPDLNKIILLSEIFSVSTDFLVKDENESYETTDGDKQLGIVQVSLEQALQYIQSKIAISQLNTKGALFCICSVVPMFLLLAMSEINLFNITEEIAAALGIVSILILVSIGVSFFIKTNYYESDIDSIDNEKFELSYGVQAAIKEKLHQYRSTYNLKTSIGVFLFIICSVPLLLVSILFEDSNLTLFMVVVLILIVAAGVKLVAPTSAQYEAYNHIIKDHNTETIKSKRTKQSEKLAAFYWPLVVAIFLGWSLWTTEWSMTWIIWPVSAVLFAALVGLMELLDKNER